MKLQGVRGSIELHRKSGEKVAARGSLDVTPDDRLEGKGHVDVDGQVGVSLDGGSIRARSESGQPVISLDNGTAALVEAAKGSKLIVETPQGTVRPEGRMRLDVKEQETALVVLEGHALVATREKPKAVDVHAGEHATIRPGGTNKRSASRSDLEKGRALARRALVTWCAAAPLDGWTPGPGTIGACKDAPCKGGKSLASTPDAGSQKAVLKVDGSAEGTRVPLRGSFRFAIKTPKPLMGKVTVSFGEAAFSSHVFAADGGAWETIKLPVSFGARRHEGVAGWSPILEVAVTCAEPFEVCDIAFDGDTDSGRSDGLREEPFVSLRFDRGEKEAAESVVGGRSSPFDLVSCHIARPRLLGPDKNGALVLDAASAELVAREPAMPSNRSDDAPIAVRYTAHGGERGTQVKVTIVGSNGKIGLRGRNVATGSWGFYEEMPDLDVAVRMAFKQRLLKLMLTLNGDGSARNGLQVDDVEVFFWVR